MDEFDNEPEQPPQGFFRRFRLAIIVTVVLLVGIILVAKLASSGGSSKRDSITLVNLAPMQTPPPMMTPPPPPPQQEEQKMEEPMIKEDAPKEAPPPDEPPLGTGIKGDGGDSFGLSDKAGNGRIGGNQGNGTKWGWYASRVQSRIQQALQQNRKTRTANMSVKIRIWPDPSGRISRAQLAESTGDPSLDGALRDEVLTGLQLSEPPPSDMPAPITLRVSAHRPR